VLISSPSVVSWIVGMSPSGVSWIVGLFELGGSADFVAIWSIMDSWFIQMRRGTVGVCNAIVRWLRVITRSRQVVNMTVNKGIDGLRLILCGIHQAVK
jgi:hypothetical protein